MTEQKLPGLNGQWIAWDEFPARGQDGNELGDILQLDLGKRGARIAKWNVAKEDRAEFWRPFTGYDLRPICETRPSPLEKQKDDSPAPDLHFQVGQFWKTVDGSVVRIESVGVASFFARGISGPITRMCSDSFLWNYFHTGECCGDNYDFNLVEMIPPNGIKHVFAYWGKSGKKVME